MPSIAELEKTKAELALALQELDQLERLSCKVNGAAGGNVVLQHQQQPNNDGVQVQKTVQVRMSEADRLKVESIKEANTALRQRNHELETEVSRYREEKRRVDADLKQLQSRSDKLKEDIEKVGSEKALLSQIVKNTQGENEVLSKVMNKISNDYEELKKAFDSQKCPKDDKILALRKTARALETENELLQEEKMKIIKDQDRIRNNLEATIKDRQTQIDNQSRELANTKLERDQLRGRLEQADKDKQSLVTKVAGLEKELTAAKAKTAKVEQEKQEVGQEKQIVEETLVALKDSKRFVELKFQNYLQERSKTTENIATLTEEKQMLQAENCSLREHIDTLEAEQKTHHLVMSELQRALEDKTRECDARMRDMQREVSSRLDEITVTRHEDKELMRLEFAGLFDEKAGELAAVRQEMAAKEAELHSREVRISELEYRETELNQTIAKLRGKNIDPDICRRTEELLEKCSRNTQDLEAKMASIREQYETGRLKYSNHVTNLTKEICDMKQVIQTKDLMIQDLRDKHQKAFENNFPALIKSVTENTPATDKINNIKDTPNKTDINNEIDELNQDKNNNKTAHLSDTPERTAMPSCSSPIPSSACQPQAPLADQSPTAKSQPQPPVNKRKRKNQKKSQKKNSILTS